MMQRLLSGVLIVSILGFLSLQPIHCQDKPTTAPVQNNHYSTDYNHRLVFSPTVNLPPGITADVSVGPTVSLLYADGIKTFRPTLFLGYVVLDSMLYAEAGMMQPNTYSDLSENFYPLTFGVRGDLLRSNYFKLGLGYQLYEAGYMYSIRNDREIAEGVYEEVHFDLLHWFYGSVSYTPGNNTYTFSMGPRWLDSEEVMPAFSLGSSLSLGRYFSFLIDIGFLGGTATSTHVAIWWFWTGVRYHNPNFKVDFATTFGFIWSLTVGIPFR